MTTTTTIGRMRRASGTSQVDLAIKAGLQPGLLCRYERGLRPSKRNACRVAAALGCAPEVAFPDFQRLREY